MLQSATRSNRQDCDVLRFCTTLVGRLTSGRELRSCELSRGSHEPAPALSDFRGSLGQPVGVADRHACTRNTDRPALFLTTRTLPKSTCTQYGQPPGGAPRNNRRAQNDVGTKKASRVSVEGHSRRSNSGNASWLVSTTSIAIPSSTRGYFGRQRRKNALRIFDWPYAIARRTCSELRSLTAMAPLAD
jgi:hypothetical protein